MKKLFIFLLAFQLVLVFMLSGCETFRLSNNKKYRNYFPVKDEYSLTQEEIARNSFDLNIFTHPDTNEKVQFVTPADIKQIVGEINDKLLIIYYYPRCQEAIKEVEIAKFAEDNDLRYLLLSDTYCPDRMKELYTIHGLKNRNQYIIPTAEKGEEVLLRKRLNFMKELAPDLYTTFKDELIFKTLMILSKDGVTMVNSKKGPYDTKDFLTNWIKEEYDIKN